MGKIYKKYKIIITLILKNIIYLCWYSYAFLMIFFVKDNLTDKHLLALIISFLSIYFIRELAKHFYKLVAHKTYQEIKHNIEMHYYGKIKNITMDKLAKIDKDYLSSKILEVSYNSTKIISDIGEYIIPAIIGLIVLVGTLFKLHYIIALVIIFLILITLLLRYRKLKNSDTLSVNNYNDLLKDFVQKIDTIKKLNIFDYSYKKLDQYDENNIIILKHNDEVSDIKFNNGIFIILAIILISTFFLIENTTTRLGMIIFYSIIIIKLQNLLYQVAPTIINYKENTRNKQLLDANYDDISPINYDNAWKKITVKDGIVKYGNGISIKIPMFELTKGDQISILGNSGQGKSTILNILSGISSLSEGSILFDNKEKNHVVDASYISKDTTYFKMSLRDNIALGEDITDDELLKMIDEVGLTNWFNNLSHGLDTILDEKEIKITNSQKQRINILRIMITSKDVIFLDEPTSDLDVDTETKVADMIKKYLKKKTLIIVTHKAQLTTICKKHFFVQNYTLLETEPLL